MDHPRDGRGVHRRRHNSRCSPLYRHGFCVVLPYQRRPQLHPGAGLRQRPHHFGCLCAHCWPAAWYHQRHHSVRHPHCQCPHICCGALVAGVLTQKLLVKSRGEAWFKNQFLPKLKPVSIVALLATLVLLFAFQGTNIISNPFIILLAAIPLIIQTYFIFFLTWFAGKKLKLPHPVCSPAAMIGASNFFELAVAVAIALFGLQSPAALVTVVGVLVEVPIMLSLVALANKWKY